MAKIATLSAPFKEDWLYQLGDVITDPNELLTLLKLNDNAELQSGYEARRLFPLRVPRAFAARMKPGDPRDPLLLQVLTAREEFLATTGFTADPLDEQNSVVPGLLHKYSNRALLLVKSGCAVNCRYCFRRHFPYQGNQGSKANWVQALDYIRKHTELDEIIFSGGDPLMAKDHELDWLISELEGIAHIRRLRIHTRLLVVTPARITNSFCRRLGKSRLQILMVTHINHANEIDETLCTSVAQLKKHDVAMLNQSVLLRGVNDSADVLAELSNKLFDASILPYYIHMLDKVQGAAHFMVNDDEARAIMKELMSKVSGYMVPKLTREISGKPSKTILDLRLEQS